MSSKKRLFTLHEDDEAMEHGSYGSGEISKSVTSGPERKKNTAADFNLATESPVSQRSFVELQNQVLRQQYGLCGFEIKNDYRV